VVEEFLYFVVQESNGTRYQSGSFFLISVGNDFHCLRTLLLFVRGEVLLAETNNKVL
jgi:hypothetical protein